jgi:hypothetical protein
MRPVSVMKSAEAWLAELLGFRLVRWQVPAWGQVWPSSAQARPLAAAYARLALVK